MPLASVKFAGTDNLVKFLNGLLSNLPMVRPQAINRYLCVNECGCASLAEITEEDLVKVHIRVSSLQGGSDGFAGCDQTVYVASGNSDASQALATARMLVDGAHLRKGLCGLCNNYCALDCSGTVTMEMTDTCVTKTSYQTTSVEASTVPITVDGSVLTITSIDASLWSRLVASKAGDTMTVDDNLSGYYVWTVVKETGANVVTLQYGVESVLFAMDDAAFDAATTQSFWSGAGAAYATRLSFTGSVERKLRQMVRSTVVEDKLAPYLNLAAVSLATVDGGFGQLSGSALGNATAIFELLQLLVVLMDLDIDVSTLVDELRAAELITGSGSNGGVADDVVVDSQVSVLMLMVRRMYVLYGFRAMV